MKEPFPDYTSAFAAKLIYVFRILDKTHDGFLKIGEATIPREAGDPAALPPNCSALNKAAKARIDSYTKTAGVQYVLLHAEALLPATPAACHHPPSGDGSVHSVLVRSGIPRHDFDLGNAHSEWFKCTLAIAKAAIAAARRGDKALDPASAARAAKTPDPIVFRDEQLRAVGDTVARFSSHDRFLWNAKMRFGKTLTAFETARRLAAASPAAYRRILVFTHRPDVNKDWHDDFLKLFRGDKAWRYGSKTLGESFSSLESFLAGAKAGDHHVVYFASHQDLGGSDPVGGKYDKNAEVFSAPWDLIIVDEAHEGTRTELGQAMLSLLRKRDPSTGRPVQGKAATRVLELSGTPFNLLDEYKEEETFTWDYVDEQQAKADWERDRPGDPNPYAGLPRMMVSVFDAASDIDPGYTDLHDLSFSFREFFRTWTGDPDIDGAKLPSSVSAGDFVHEDDVRRFLDRICAPLSGSRYPFSKPEWRDTFRHTLWMVPGVASARALSALLKAHGTFGSGAFQIVNVAGAGDDEVPQDKARDMVAAAMGDDPGKTRTITLSCGRLTTGVSIPPWGAVLMLAGSYETDAKSYMQTVFRVQTPYTTPAGRRKEECHVFDFAPDRVLRVFAEVSRVAAARRKKPSGGGDPTQAYVGKLLNFCPVVSLKGASLKRYDADALVEHVKRARIDRVVARGFETADLYRDDMLRELDKAGIALFEGLRAQIGTTKAANATSDTVLAAFGATGEERELLGKGKKPPRALTPEEKAAAEEARRKKEIRDAAVSILRGISIRMPIMLYGAEIADEEKEITIENFPNLVDDASWEEFMPKAGKEGHAISKETFRKFIKYYDPDVFRAAGRRIRSLARSLDSLSPLERIRQLAVIFGYFRNPDRETVLTPWDVVDRHMSDTLGGWSFFNWPSSSKSPLREGGGGEAVGGSTPLGAPLPAPHFVTRTIDGENVTSRAFAPSSRILEINSKTGLYPLWCAYSIFRAKCASHSTSPLREGGGGKAAGGSTAASMRGARSRATSGPPADVEAQRDLWDEVLRENIFVVCKTKMARAITLRTLRGFRTGVRCNVRAFDDFINQFRNKPDLMRMKLRNGAGYWKTNEETAMHFNAIVGNPPYQEMGGSGGTNDASIYQLFCSAATELEPDYVSMVIPSRWFAGGRENLLGEFRRDMLAGGRVRCLHAFASSRDLFPTVEIKGGVCYYLEIKDKKGPCQYYLHRDGEMLPYPKRELDRFDILVRDPELARIVETVRAKCAELGETETVDSLLSGDTPFGIPTNPASSKKTPFPVRDKRGDGFDVELDMLGEGQKRTIAYVRRADIKKNVTDIDFDKVFISKSGGSGADDIILSEPIVAPKGSVCSQTFIYAKFGSAEEAKNFAAYLKTRFFRALVSARKITQDALSKVYSFVPVQDFTRPWTDADLFAKYALDAPAQKWIETNIREMK